MTRTYLDTGVLIAGARGNDPTSPVALGVLDDPDRQFASSAFVRLEALPKAQHNGRQAEVAFYQAYFDAVLFWPSNMAGVIGEVQRSPNGMVWERWMHFTSPPLWRSGREN